MYGKPVGSWEQFSRTVIEHADEAIPIQVRHQEHLLELKIKPKILVKYPTEPNGKRLHKGCPQ